MQDISLRGVTLRLIGPLLDGELIEPERVAIQSAETDGITRIDLQLVDATTSPHSLGLRFEAIGVQRYLRNGYHSWDGSYFAEPGTSQGDGPPEKAPTLGFAMTALLPDEGAVLLGYERHDRFQNRFRFGGTADAMTIDVETLIDATGETCAETLLLFDDPEVEEALRRWSRAVAAASPLPPRVPEKRISGWCSWYNLYAAINEENILEHLYAARNFRDTHQVPLDIFLIDDGFTPEMGDWLDVKPQFPRGMAPLLSDIAAQGFTPGLWIAPFMVGNRSKLYAAHPDWVVQDRVTGGPLVQMRFYGEFRWHKRSEEYYILDITHPDAAAYIATVFRTWATEWGAGYFKTDFMFFGAEYGPDRAVWHQSGLSRVAIWRQMAEIIRKEIGNALWLGCGSPLWASIGLVDAVRIGRDVGVKWAGEQSAESLLRDLSTRNHANGVLWQADPDCLLLRDRFHDLNDAQIDSLARYAAASGGVLMTSDTLSELPDYRGRLFAQMLSNRVEPCRFPVLGREKDRLIHYISGGKDHIFNLSADTVRYQGMDIAPFATVQI